jgi:hypothetical protein
MNERIKELMFDAGLNSDYVEGFDSIYSKQLEKFAELIVRECAKSANDWYQNHDKIHSDPMSYVLAHFGVEE